MTSAAKNAATKIPVPVAEKPIEGQEGGLRSRMRNNRRHPEDNVIEARNRNSQNRHAID
jgi:hypothetical protein